METKYLITANRIFESDTWETQNEMVAEYLNRGFTLTPKQAYENFGVMRLSARIHDLKNTHSHLIADDGFIETDSMTKNDKTFAVYWVERPATPDGEGA